MCVCVCVCVKGCEGMVMVKQLQKKQSGGEGVEAASFPDSSTALSPKNRYMRHKLGKSQAGRVGKVSKPLEKH